MDRNDTSRPEATVGTHHASFSPGGDNEKTLVTAAFSIFIQLRTPEVSRWLHDVARRQSGQGTAEVRRGSQATSSSTSVLLSSSSSKS
jgi:hypothetical protein